MATAKIHNNPIYTFLHSHKKGINNLELELIELIEEECAITSGLGKYSAYEFFYTFPDWTVNDVHEFYLFHHLPSKARVKISNRLVYLARQIKGGLVELNLCDMGEFK